MQNKKNAPDSSSSQMNAREKNLIFSVQLLMMILCDEREKNRPHFFRPDSCLIYQKEEKKRTGGQTHRKYRKNTREAQKQECEEGKKFFFFILSFLYRKSLLLI